MSMPEAERNVAGLCRKSFKSPTGVGCLDVAENENATIL